MTLRKTRSIAFGVGNGGTWAGTAGAGVETSQWDLVNERYEVDANDASALRYLLAYSESGYASIRQVRVEAKFQRLEYPKKWPVVGLFARLQENGECYALILRAVDSDQQAWVEIRKGIWSEIAHGGGDLLTPHDVDHTVYMDDDGLNSYMALQVFNNGGCVVIDYYLWTLEGRYVVDKQLQHKSLSLITAGGGAGVLAGVGDGTPNGVDATTKLYVDDFLLFGHDRTFADVLPGDAPVTLIEVDRKTQGTLYLSCGPAVNGPAATYQARIVGAERIGRGYAAEVEMQGFGLNIGDADAALRSDVGALEFENQEVRVKVGLLDEENVIEYETIFTGQIVGGGSCNQDRVSLAVEVKEPFGRFVINDGTASAQLPVVSETLFSAAAGYNLDAAAVGQVIPLVFGDLYKIGGAVPGIYVGTYRNEANQTGREWVLSAFHVNAIYQAPLQIEDVWIKGKDDGEWRLLHEPNNTGFLYFRTLGVICLACWRSFDETVQSYCELNQDGAEIAFNVRAHYTTVSVYSNTPVKIIHDIVQYYSARVSGNDGLARCDTANFAELDDLCEQWGVQVCGVIDDAEKTVLEVIGEMLATLDLRAAWTGNNKLQLHWFTPDVSANAADYGDFYSTVRLAGEHEANNPQFAFAPQGEGLFGNLTDVSWPDGDDETRDVFDTTSRAARERTLAQELELPWLMDSVRQFAAAIRYLTTRQNPRMLVEYESDGRGWAEALDDVLRLTHYYGPGAGGWTGRPLEIWGQQYDPQSHQTVVRAADVPAVFNNDGAFCADFATLGITADGTAQVAAGSGVIVGTGTQFSLAQVGDAMRVYDASNPENCVLARVTAIYSNVQIHVSYSSWISASGLSFEIVKGLSRASDDERTKYLYLCNSNGDHAAADIAGKRFW